MKYTQHEPYIIKKGAGRKASRGGYRPIGLLIAVLLFLTAAICLSVAIIPRFIGKSVGVTIASVPDKTFYFLCTAETEKRETALLAAQSATERGGAGYIYNDGKYRVVAAVYSREVDAKTLVGVNPDSYYFAADIKRGEQRPGDRAAIDYLCGEWFDIMHTAATELDRGNITEAAAECAAITAAIKLSALSENVESKSLYGALTECKYIADHTKSTQVNMRSHMVKTILSVISVLTYHI